MPKWCKILLIVLAVLAVLAAGGVLGWQALMGYFINQYYRTAYEPVELTAELAGEAPPAYHLSDLPWLATANPFCAATSLRMIAAQHGREASLSEVIFYMGWTYGASYGSADFSPSSITLFPFTDPEPALLAGAPYLGLERQHYVTSDAQLFLRALRFLLSRGYAVRLPLDMAVLYNLPERTPHSDVLAGYDAEGFYLYETVCLEGVPCQPGDRGPGERGLYFSDAVVLEAVRSLSAQFRHPWRYSLTVFDSAPTVTELKPLWRRLGQSLLGGNRYGPPTGADAIEAAAKDLERSGRFDEEFLTYGLGIAADTRRDMAAYLRERFAGEQDIQQAAAALERAAGAYQQALAVGRQGSTLADTRAMASALRTAAAAEREAARVMLARGE
ncbi:MAG: hypothetical protein ACUVX9_00245 [Anaerolineae bacterium]